MARAVAMRIVDGAGGGMADVFISYKSERRAAVEHLARILELNGYSVWFDYGLLSGQNFARQIEREIRAAKVVVVLWCGLSVDSEWVNGEARLASRLGKMIPVWIEDVDLPLEFNGADTINLKSWDGSPRSHMLDRLFEQIALKVGREQEPQIAGLKEFDKAWRRYGAPGLLSFALEKAIPEFEKPAGSDGSKDYGSQRERQISDEDGSRQAAAVHGKEHRRTSLVLITAAALACAALAGGGLFLWRPQQPSPALPGPTAGALSEKTTSQPPPVAVQPVENLPATIPATGNNVVENVPEIASAPPEAGASWSGPKFFRDCDICPVMATLPSARFLIGSPDGEAGHKSSEAPRREIAIRPGLSIGRSEVSFAEWDACVAAGGCRSWRPDDYGMGRGKSPVIFVSWDDATAFTAWLSAKTGATYRLPSEAEWEFAARGCLSGSCTNAIFAFGNEITPEKANYNWNIAYNGSPRRQPRRQTMAVDEGSPANAFGLLHVHGNVAEWVQDCVTANYDRLAGDGTAVVTGDCRSRMVRGGHWNDNPRELRAAARSFEEVVARTPFIGFRVVREAGR